MEIVGTGMVLLTHHPRTKPDDRGDLGVCRGSITKHNKTNTNKQNQTVDHYCMYLIIFPKKDTFLEKNPEILHQNQSTAKGTEVDGFLGGS